MDGRTYERTQADRQTDRQTDSAGPATWPVPVHGWSCVVSLTKRAPAAAVHAEQVQSCQPGANNCYNPNQFLYAYNATGKLKGSLHPLYVTPAGTSAGLSTRLCGASIGRHSLYLRGFLFLVSVMGRVFLCGMQPGE
jgi:hypothetical protein